MSHTLEVGQHVANELVRQHGETSIGLQDLYEPGLELLVVEPMPYTAIP